MGMRKSINSRFVFAHLLSLVFLLLCDFFLFSHAYKGFGFFLTFLWFFLPYLFVLDSKHRRVLTVFTCVYLFLLCFFVVFLDRFREFFPFPEINEAKSIGYAQYYGYPLQFDLVFFLLFVLFPIFFFISFRAVKRLKKNR